MKGIPEETMILAGYPHIGRVCQHCKAAYFEQISAWLLANGTGGIGPKTTLTRSDMITFQ